jgi:hypothetical protein
MMDNRTKLLLAKNTFSFDVTNLWMSMEICKRVQQNNVDISVMFVLEVLATLVA